MFYYEKIGGAIVSGGDRWNVALIVNPRAKDSQIGYTPDIFQISLTAADLKLSNLFFSRLKVPETIRKVTIQRFWTPNGSVLDGEILTARVLNSLNIAQAVHEQIWGVSLITPPLTPTVFLAESWMTEYVPIFNLSSLMLRIVFGLSLLSPHYHY